jgi:O-acetyl-ADP-ribose deacetylase (regulator of RNase III)
MYGYPRDEAAAVASDAIAEFLTHDSFIQEIRLVFFSEREADVFVKHHRFPTES